MEIKKPEHAEILTGKEPTTDTKSDIPDRARENQNANTNGNTCDSTYCGDNLVGRLSTDGES